MNFKEANQIVVEGWGYCSHKPSREQEEYSEAKGFIEATQSAQPLLEVIEKQRKALQSVYAYWHRTNPWEENSRDDADAWINVGESLSSSAPVVEKYKRETLGEE